MIYSMTGYAVLSRELPQGALDLELRSVNHRYLDIQFRLPEEFRTLEPAMRELLASQLTRGKVDCRLSFSLSGSRQNLQHLNTELLQKVLELNRAVQTMLPDSQGLRVADILRWPGMLGADAVPVENLHATCLELLQTALSELSAARSREGEKLKAMLLERVARMGTLAATVAPKIPALLAAFEEKLTGRMREAMINCDDDRIRQELALFAGKIDVAEELSRLQSHLDEVARILDNGGAVGKRLDFLMQELNREANTLGSKSIDTEVSRVSVDLKVLIEQMREQIQNIE